MISVDCTNNICVVIVVLVVVVVTMIAFSSQHVGHSHRFLRGQDTCQGAGPRTLPNRLHYDLFGAMERGN